jgi:hypothetical protein
MRHCLICFHKHNLHITIMLGYSLQVGRPAPIHDGQYHNSARLQPTGREPSPNTWRPGCPLRSPRGWCGPPGPPHSAAGSAYLHVTSLRMGIKWNNYKCCDTVMIFPAHSFETLQDCKGKNQDKTVTRDFYRLFRPVPHREPQVGFKF